MVIAIVIVTMTTETKNKKETEMNETKKFFVFHTKNWALNTLLHFNQKTFTPHMEDYKHVASVYATDIEEVFRDTNHIDREWWENENVNLVEKSRSTSVGDVVVDNKLNVFVCASSGWIKTKWDVRPKSECEWWKENGERYKEYAAHLALG